jgi:hypothetical protein
LIVTKTPAPTKNVAQRAAEPLYVAGNFNSWNPKDENFKLKPLGNRQQIVLKDIPAGMYAFKFTRGDWSKVETTTDGRDIADRVIEVKGDMTEEIESAGLGFLHAATRPEEKSVDLSSKRICYIKKYLPGFVHARRAKSFQRTNRTLWRMGR